MPRRYMLGWYKVRMLLPSYQNLSKSLTDIKLIVLHKLRGRTELPFQVHGLDEARAPHSL